MVEETPPGTADDDGPDSIVPHVDMDCFYTACECLREPELGGEPVVVGMGYEPDEGHGAAATASYEAHELGVDSVQPISTALEHLPRIDDLESGDDPTAASHYRTVDLEFYKSVAADAKMILHDCADVVCEVSTDEAYLDVTDRIVRDFAASGNRTPVEGFVYYVKQRIAREVSVVASIGVVPNIPTAEIAPDFDKPDGLVVVHPGEVQSFLVPTSVEEVHSTGPVTARKLGSSGIETAGDLANADAAVLEVEFDSRDCELHEWAHGCDDWMVMPTGRPKSLLRESAFTNPTDGIKDKWEVVRVLVADVADHARFHGATYRTIGIKVVVPPFDINTRATSLSGPVDDPELVELVALDLLDAELAGMAVRKLDVRVSESSFADADQLSLDSWEPAEAGKMGGDGDEHVSDEPPNTDDEALPRGSQSSLVKFD